MLSEDDNRRLTRVGPGTPMGALLRRYWHPIAAERELEADRVRPVRLLGEDLVLFRDGAGSHGLVARHCPHRGADLSYGMAAEDGIRCSYHGWCFDARGRCTEQPFEDVAHPDGRFRERVAITAYPVALTAGLVWAYLGPAPAPCLMDWARFHDPGEPAIRLARIPCNWLQCQENSIDPVHFEWLHQNLPSQRFGSGSRAPRHLKVAFEEFEFGFVYRRVLDNTDEAHPLWTVGRVALWPECLFTGAFTWHVPIDDESTLDVTWTLLSGGERRADAAPFQRVDLQRLADGRYSVHDVWHQDAVAMLGQGTVADRTREHLGESDRGVILLRQRLLEEIEAVAADRDPKGVLRDEALNQRIALPLVLEAPEQVRGPRPPAAPGQGRLRDKARALVLAAREAALGLRTKASAPRGGSPDLVAMIHGFRLSALLYVVAELRVADALAGGARDERELAREVGAHAESLGRILRALAAHGVFAERSGRFGLTDTSRRLRADAKGSLRGLALLAGEEFMPAWRGLLHSARTGETAFDHVFGMSNWEHRRRHPELDQAFNDFIASGAEWSAARLAESYDFTTIERLTDLGGGTGTFLAHLLRRHRHLKGTLLDQPHVVAGAPAVLMRMGVSDRCAIVAGDLFSGVPGGADAYLLKNVLHDWADAQAIAILKACRAACGEKARLLVVEALLPARTRAGSSTLMTDIHMLAVDGGRERDEAAYRALLSAGGFRLARSVPIAGELALLEALPA